ncbi:hypothetical protein LCGC14_0235550 [marine sediment metagenome]|uniref:GATA-type domain-containing protein n=1 Tax=marine sediment metagenome TaxID=412755 RepID=A0A0F9UDG3_9ZZZZ
MRPRGERISQKYPWRRDSYGNYICALCGKCCNGRRKYCSTECQDVVYIECDPGFARMKVRQRDHGVCAICGRDYGMLKRTLRRVREIDWVAWDWIREALGLGNRTHFWEAHHKIAVANGGGGCGLNGYETICFRCHPKLTGVQRKARNQDKGE